MLLNDGWEILKDDNNVVAYRLTETHKLYVTRVPGGLEIRLIEEEKDLKPIVLYRNSINNRQLGFITIK